MWQDGSDGYKYLRKELRSNTFPPDRVPEKRTEPVTQPALIQIYDIKGKRSIDCVYDLNFYLSKIINASVDLSQISSVKDVHKDTSFERFHGYVMSTIIERETRIKATNELILKEFICPVTHELLEAWLSADLMMVLARRFKKKSTQLVAVRGERIRCPECEEVIYEFKTDYRWGHPLLATDLKPVGNWPRAKGKDTAACPNCGTHKWLIELPNCIVE